MDTRETTILKRAGLSLTDSRQKILEFFTNSFEALAHSDIEKLGKENFDRVTIYRTLQIFVEKGILHTIPTADNSVLYALCKDNCEEGHHHDKHVHFVCNVCGRAFCLESVSFPRVTAPRGFKVYQTDIVLKGVCGTCD